jgi:GAF domain-containing protein
VAQNSKPILNGNPSVEPGYLNDPTKYSTLRSALAVPLEGSGSVVAVLALYRTRQDGFSRDDLKVLEAIGEGIGSLVAGALRDGLADSGDKSSVNASAARAGAAD